MKKNILALFILFSCLSLFSQGPINIHTRNTFLSPTILTHFQLPAMVKVKFSNFNIGPDTIFVGDTFMMSLNFQGMRTPRSKIVMKRNIVPGDSMVFEDSMLLDFDLQFSDRFFVRIDPGIFFNKNKETKREFTSDIASNSDNNIVTFFKFTISKTSIYEPITSDLGFVIYPNPVSDELNLKNEQLLEGLYQIYSADGKKLKEGFIDKMMNYTIDVKDLSSGFYFMNLYTGNKKQVVKLIKQ